MSPTDLNILADAVTFAMLVAIGGLIVFAAVRSTWKRHVLQHSAKVGLSVLVVVVVVAAGVALWPAAREGVNTAAGVDLDEQGRLIVTETEDFEPPSPMPERERTKKREGRRDRVRTTPLPEPGEVTRPMPTPPQRNQRRQRKPTQRHTPPVPWLVTWC